VKKMAFTSQRSHLPWEVTGRHMCHFKDELDQKGHFWFDKKLIENVNWAALPQASKTIYPVIGCHQNEAGEAFPGEQKIAVLSGRTEKIVRQGIIGLDGFPGFKAVDYVTRRGRRSKKFKISRPPRERGRGFPFYKAVLEGGHWLHLTPSAQALYPVLRNFGYFDINTFEVYCEEEEADSECNPIHFDEIYEIRSWDVCEAEEDILAEYSGISKRSIPGALESLRRSLLIADYQSGDIEGWKVFLRPAKYYNRSYLNEKIIGKYRHLQSG